jgi:hypothetical protein
LGTIQHGFHPLLNYSMVAVAPLPPCLVELKPAWFPYGRKDWNQSKYNILELKMIYMWFSGQVVSALAFHLWSRRFKPQWELSQCDSNPVLMWKESKSTLCRKSWVFPGYSGFLPQGKLTGWVRLKGPQ